MDEIREDELTPNPEFGMPPNPNLEVTEYLTQNKSFIYRDGKEGQDDAVVDGDLPPHIKHHFWSFISKDSVLTFIRNEQDIWRIMEMLELAIESYEMRLKPGQYTYDTLAHLDNLRKIVFDKTLRSHKGFERKLEATQIQQSLYGSAESEEPRQRSGWMSSIGRAFGGVQK